MTPIGFLLLWAACGLAGGIWHLVSRFVNGYPISAGELALCLVFGSVFGIPFLITCAIEIPDWSTIVIQRKHLTRGKENGESVK